ncbi:hypothetical protein ACFFX0_08540 [Citricoccus parietis]|uniref:Uncharacterized protein n=1 Tax=Citricoccus parietis TaxID=592307 RepID=A0ABV5FXT2_9MICC
MERGRRPGHRTLTATLEPVPAAAINQRPRSHRCAGGRPGTRSARHWPG